MATRIRVNKDTDLYFSVARKPGNFGSLLYNKAFEYLEINAIYKPLYWEYDLVQFLYYIPAVRASGISVSMPFKKEAHEQCNYGSIDTRLIGNANTIVFPEGTWGTPECYNTDYLGFERACESLLSKSKTAVVYGSGAVADSIVYILKHKHIDVEIVKRNGFNCLKYMNADLLINATPVGMDEIPDDIFISEVIERFKYVFDVVVKRETNLIKNAIKLNKLCVSGVSMSFEQLCEQFRIYTGEDAPRDILVRELQENGYL